MKTLISTLILSFLITGLAQAHEGHDKTPGALTAPHGGVIQGTSQLYFEVLNNKNEITLYPLDHESKPVDPHMVQLTATATVPRKAKAEKIDFKTEGDHFKANFDPKGAHRYELAIDVNYKGKKEKVKFNIEPQ